MAVGCAEEASIKELIQSGSSMLLGLLRSRDFGYVEADDKGMGWPRCGLKQRGAGLRWMLRSWLRPGEWEAR